MASKRPRTHPPPPSPDEVQVTELLLRPQTRYDQAARYLLTRTRGNFFHWLLKLTPAQVRFDAWRSPQLTVPGLPQRLCDGVAELTYLQKGKGRPFAALLELQSRPDFLMPGRLMVAGGLFWMTAKPNELVGDRFELVGIVINLTGVGDSARASTIGTSEWTLKPIELNIETLDAGEILDLIGTGAVPWELLAFIPLMKRGDESGIIERWRRLVRTRLDEQERGDCGLARYFAELVKREEYWRDAMNEIGFVESPMIGKMLSETRATALAEGEARGEARGRLAERAEIILLALRGRPGKLPKSLVNTITTCTDAEQLSSWLGLALAATSVAEFRQNAGL